MVEKRVAVMFEQFGWMHIVALLRGAGLTLWICIASTILGCILGLFLGMGELSSNKIIRSLCRAYVNLVRGIPLLIILFFIYYAIPILFRMNVSQATASLSGLSLYAGAYIGEIVRGSIAAIPKGQFEASDSLGLTIVQKYCFVIMPQAIRNMIPSLVGFIIALIKDSSLVFVIGYIDLTRAGRTVGNLTMQPLLTFLCVGVIYFVICYSLSMLSSYTERRMKIK
ncbi:MAG: amino acid ABC transporter permease [Clostridia bacterium]|nr:amino acid ABC transporter permease [Clostridia bacterium]